MLAKTYRCNEEKAMRIEAIKKRMGKSFQSITDEFWDTLLFRLRTETGIFSDLTPSMQIKHVVDNILETPKFRFWFTQKKNLHS